MAGGVHGMGACMARGACMAGVWHAPSPLQILRDTVNDRAVRILLECVLVTHIFYVLSNFALVQLIYTFWIANEEMFSS